MTQKDLDILCIGRSSVDLYGQQVGGRLEDMGSFAKYVGGSPTNTSIGAARLGLKSALLTRVGNEHMGRFIRENLESEGVDTTAVITDPKRLTALVLLGIQDEERFPLIFYRENCADMAITEQDVSPQQIARTRAVVLSGTHFSTVETAKANEKAMTLAKEHGAKVVLDIDYRPNLWNLAGHGDGESRFIADQSVTEHIQQYLGGCDLIVGTEEEFHIAGGSDNSLEALSNVRKLTDAILVCKRGALGCRVFESDIDGWESGVTGPGFKIEVFNVLGAGDAFMAGLLRGWLRNESWEKTCAYANACGAFAVSRHGCCPAYPSEIELFEFIENGSECQALRFDQDLNHIHRTTNRPKTYGQMLAFACDHRVQFENWATEYGRDTKAINQFKQLAWQAAFEEGKDVEGFGVLLDDKLGRQALHTATSTNAWIGRPIEASGVFPLAFEAEAEIIEHLADWPLNQTVKVLCPYRLNDDDATREHHETLIKQLNRACLHTGHEWLLEIITARKGSEPHYDTVAEIVARFYEIGVKPDWWKLEPGKDDAYWKGISTVIEANDPYCHGIILLGLDGSIEDISQSIQIASSHPLVKGFAIGRTLFGESARSWLAGKIDDETAVTDMRGRYRQMLDVWANARP
ncbi:bifunctional 5-dehydro-2-deoxygluconokinase/5-dehydro-2-deoxyphosphogluconate aldolase [Leucothrix arctica]|uniref:5-dehydro-2-deoxygluconokinase n=1 Tax=Leucothrix arctica TaxID=1481894 RepID=A0A317CMD3_9GAMM|nr:5-dehydro-2-deoxygluconokinase [Leucothrix arctica]PWQ99381.1 5-dehydro-2-deoxygluconokinase [Leucothrix arctica]